MAKWHPSFIPVWRPAPLLKIIFSYGFGAFLYWQFALKGWTVLVAFLSGTLLLLLGYFFLKRPNQIWTIVMHWVLISLGLLNAFLQYLPNHADFIGKHYTKDQPIIATISASTTEKPNSYRAEATVRVYDSLKGWQSVSGNIILYFEKSKQTEQLRPGDAITFNRPLQGIKNSGNPGAYNYQRQAAFHSLFYQVYLRSHQFTRVGYTPPDVWSRFLIHTKQLLLDQLRQFIPNKDALGLAQALLLGYREDLDKQLAEEYAGTGVAHIIAISGLHLALLVAPLQFILLPITRLKHGKKYSPILVIIVLWVFALLTGGSASVMRSALMFTFLLGGEVLGKQTNKYNSLAASALALLIYNPFLLWDVGFQLSYSAVLSIFIFNDPIAKWWQPTAWLPQKIWQMLSVTISAQILTLPFVVYHFHQFPVYFLLANLVAVPLSGWILYGLIGLLALSWWSWLAGYIGVICSWSIGIMNGFVTWVNHLPLSKIDNIYLTIPQTIALFLVIVMAGSWLLRQSKIAFVAMTAFGVLFFILRGFQWQQLSNQQKLVVYNIPQQTAIDVFRGNRFWYWGDSAVLAPGFLRNFHVLPSRIVHQATPLGFCQIGPAAFHELQAGSQKILLLHTEPDKKALPVLATDVLIIGANLRINPFQLLEKIKCKTLVTDGNVPDYKVGQWQSAADSLHLRFHPVTQKGAFILNF